MESLSPVASMGYWANRSVHGVVELDAPAKKKATKEPKSPKTNNNASKKAVHQKKEESKLLESWEEVIKVKKTAMNVKASADVGNELRWDVILSAMKEMGTGKHGQTVDEEKEDHEGFSTSAGDDSEEFSDCSSDTDAWEDAQEEQQIYSLSLLMSYRPTKAPTLPGFAPKGLHTRTMIALEEEEKSAQEPKSAADALISVIRVNSQSPKASSQNTKKIPTTPKSKKTKNMTQSLPTRTLKAEMTAPPEPLPPSTKAVSKGAIASAPWRTSRTTVMTPPPGLAPPPGLQLPGEQL